MNEELAYLEQFLDMICSETNVKQLVIKTSIDDLEVIYTHDTVADSSIGVAVYYKGELVDAPKAAIIVVREFLNEEALHSRKS